MRRTCFGQKELQSACDLKSPTIGRIETSSLLIGSAQPAGWCPLALDLTLSLAAAPQGRPGVHRRGGRLLPERLVPRTRVAPFPPQICFHCIEERQKIRCILAKIERVQIHPEIDPKAGQRLSVTGTDCLSQTQTSVTDTDCL